VKFLALVAKHLRHTWVRAGSTVAAVGLCVFLFCGLQSVLAEVDSYVRTRSPRRLITSNLLSGGLPLAHGPRIQRVPGVRRVAAGLIFAGFLRAKKEGRAEPGSAQVPTGRAMRRDARPPGAPCGPRARRGATAYAARSRRARRGKQRLGRTPRAVARPIREPRRATRRRRRRGTQVPSTPPRTPLRLLRASISRGFAEGGHQNMVSPPRDSVSGRAGLSSERPQRDSPPARIVQRRPTYSSRMNLRGLSATPLTRTS